MQRLAGAETFPAQITAPLAVGPEVPREGVAAIRAVFEELLPGATVAPLQLRGRAIGVLLAVGTVSEQLRDLASEAAIALELAPFYTDYIDTVRRTRPTSPAAEIQQNLLPPRIARVGGATLAGNVLPGYEIGGDWFDYTENPRGTWIGIADSAGIGAAAAGIGAVTLGAFRSTRRESTDPAQCLLAMHEVLLEIGDGAASSTATIGHWNAPASTFRWVTAGDEPPFRITADGQLKPLVGDLHSHLGSRDFPDQLTPTRPASRRPSECFFFRTASRTDARPRTPRHRTRCRQGRRQRRTSHAASHRRPTASSEPRSARGRRHHHRARPQRHDRTLGITTRRSAACGPQDQRDTPRSGRQR